MHTASAFLYYFLSTIRILLHFTIASIIFVSLMLPPYLPKGKLYGSNIGYTSSSLMPVLPLFHSPCSLVIMDLSCQFPQPHFPSPNSEG